MKVRMQIPTRTKSCNHLQCFDLMNYLMMNEKRPSWKCPNCPANAHYDNLVVDEYFMDLLKTVDSNVSEVELLRDGNWKVTQVDSDDDSDDEFVKPKVKKEVEPTKKPIELDDSVIILSSDDESPPKATSSKKNDSCEPCSKVRRKNSSVNTSDSDSDDDGSSSSSSRKRKAPGRRDTNKASSSNDVPEIITLSDDDDDVPVTRSNQKQQPRQNGTTRSTASPASVPTPVSNNGSTGNVTPQGSNGENSNSKDMDNQNQLMAQLETELARGISNFVQDIVARSLSSTVDKPSYIPFNAS